MTVPSRGGRLWDGSIGKAAMFNPARALLENIMACCGEAFADKRFSLKRRAKHAFIQKVLRVNSHVPWPVHWTTTVRLVQRIERGDMYPGLNMGCYLDGRAGIVIGENVWIGPRVSIITMNHDLCDYDTYTANGPVTIGRDCWLGPMWSFFQALRLETILYAPRAQSSHEVSKKEMSCLRVFPRLWSSSWNPTAVRRAIQFRVITHGHIETPT